MFTARTNCLGVVSGAFSDMMAGSARCSVRIARTTSSDESSRPDSTTRCAGALTPDSTASVTARA